MATDDTSTAHTGTAPWPVDGVAPQHAGLARTMLSRPGIEGDPLALLKISEAYWKVGARFVVCKHVCETCHRLWCTRQRVQLLQALSRCYVQSCESCRL